MCRSSNNYFQSIEDFITLEEEIVTYRWLSSRLNIPSNQAKQLLYGFSKWKKRDDLEVKYVVSGFSKDGSGIQVTLISESDLEQTKQRLEKVISVHVYSVCKASLPIFSLSLSHSDPSQNLSSILPRENVQSRDLQTVVIGKAQLPLPSKVTTSLPVKVTPTPLAKETQNNVQTNQKIVKNDESTQKEKDKSSKSPIKSKTSPKKTDKKKVANIKGSIGRFFNMQTEVKRNATKESKSDPLREEKKQEEIVKKEAEGASQKQDNKSSINVLKEINEQKLTQKKVAAKESKEKDKKKDKKRKKSSGDEETNKRRKRIVIESDSENSEEEMEPEPELQEEEKPQQITVESDEEVLPPTPHNEKGRKRVLKKIDKTYTDDEGFILTKKETVYESCSEDEIIPETPNKEVRTSPSKKQKTAISNLSNKKKSKSPMAKTSPQKNKQSSIMSFFKKK